MPTLLHALVSFRTTIRKATGHIGLSICLLIIAISSSLGQPRPGPCFEANITRGCVPLTVQVTNCSNDAEGPTIAYDYGIGGFTNAETFTYTQPGIYTVRQIGNFASSNGGDTLTRVDYIEVLATPPPTFILSACEEFTVEVTITDAAYDSYLINFGDGTTLVTSSNSAIRYSYSSSSIFMITVVGQHNTQPVNQVCNGGFARQMFSPRLGLIKPALNSLRAVSATDLVLNFEADMFFNYKIFQKTGATGTYQEIASVNNPQANPFGQAINTVDVSNEVYNFQVAVTDVCGNQLLSDEISSILLTTTASSNQNVLNWQIIPSPLLQSFIIYRNGQVLAEITNPNQRTFTDASVSCADEYCYQVVAQYSNTAKSFSTQSCVRAISTDIPPAIQNLTASVDNNNFALLNWQLPAGQQAGEYVVFRSDNGGEFQELGRTSGNTYLDNRGNPITPVNTYCYQIGYTNTCGNTSAQSIAACPMLLTRSTIGNNTALTWTAYSEWPGGVREYVVEKLDEQGNIYDIQVVGTSLSTGFESQIIDTTRQIVRFRIRAIPADASIQAAYSNTIELIQPVQVHLPDGFTPDGNNLNDIFTVKGLFIREYTITIYNRWGEVVFQSNSLEEGWDGQYRNEDAPAGKYVYSVRVRDSAGKPFTKEGTVQLIR